MRLPLVIVVALTATAAGCSGGPRARAPHAMIARAVPKAAKRLRGDQQQVVAAADRPQTVITGNVAR